MLQVYIYRYQYMKGGGELQFGSEGVANVQDEAIADVSLFESFEEGIDVLQLAYFNERFYAMLRAEIEHFLSPGNAANEGTSDFDVFEEKDGCRDFKRSDRRTKHMVDAIKGQG